MPARPVQFHIPQIMPNLNYLEVPEYEEEMSTGVDRVTKEKLEHIERNVA